MGTVRVLLSEGSSLTAREVITWLGPVGYHLEAVDSDPLCLARFSRWVRNVHRCPPPASDPVGYLDAVRHTVADRRIDVVLPTHEQAWLFAAAHPVQREVPVASAPSGAFERVQSKIEFARLLDELELPQPRWGLVTDARDLAGLPFPYWLKSAFSTAGRGVRFVHDKSSRATAMDALLADGHAPVMAQNPAPGQYAQVQGLFDRGRLVAAHTSVQTGAGVGGSAAARLSVDHPTARHDIEVLGGALAWHGGLTLDYLHENGAPHYIECNPRTVEPGNAAASGVNIPDLQVRLTLGADIPSHPQVGRAGIRTHGAIALLMGAAANTGSRRAVLAEAGRCLVRRGVYRGSHEQLTPIVRDPPSIIPLALVAARTVAVPTATKRFTNRAIARYSITPEAIDRLRRVTAPR
jgi:biotin carboxylase